MNIINDEYIKMEFKTKRGSINRYRLLRASEDEINYINNRYNDSQSINESLIRIFNNFEVHPLCPICGKPLSLNRHMWRKYCSNSCKSKDTANKLEQKYGVRCTLRLPDVQEKTKETCIKHYGVDNPLKSKEIHNKIKETNIKKYGVEYVSQSSIIQEKIKNTCLEKWGSEHYLSSKDCKEKTLTKFGVDNYRKTDECKQLVSNYHKENKNLLNEKRKKTCLERYGVNNPQKSKEIHEKTKQTCLKKYGYTTYSQSNEYKEFVKNNPEIYKNAQVKSYETKKKNNSFNISKTENKSYDLLKEKYSDVLKQYKSKLYPYYCDFYIPSLDLYIECNYHWTHGGHPYDKNNIDDIKLINKWLEKNTKYYDGAIYTWTIRDVNKRNIAKQNKLNYIEFWNINDLINWIKTK